MQMTIDKNAVARAARKPLESYYASITANEGDDISERPGDWEDNEELFKAIFKSAYVSSRLDWLYVLELIYQLVDQNEKLSPEQFAAGLEEAIGATAGQREYLAILLEVFACLFAAPSSPLAISREANHFFLLSKTSGEFRRLPSIKPLSIDFEWSDVLLKSIKRPEFGKFFSWISSPGDGMHGRLRNAVKFFSMALNSDDNVTSFLFYVVSVEAIFSRDKNNPIKVTLADFGSLLCFPPEQRIEAHSKIRKAYDLRSTIVHSGASSVDRKSVELAREIAARAIYASLYLCTHLEDGPGTIEDRFFNYLRDLRLGVAKAIIPRALWSLAEVQAKG